MACLEHNESLVVDWAQNEAGNSCSEYNFYDMLDFRLGETQGKNKVMAEVNGTAMDWAFGYLKLWDLILIWKRTGLANNELGINKNLPYSAGDPIAPNIRRSAPSLPPSSIDRVTVRSMRYKEFDWWPNAMLGGRSVVLVKLHSEIRQSKTENSLWIF